MMCFVFLWLVAFDYQKNDFVKFCYLTSQRYLLGDTSEKCYIFAKIELSGQRNCFYSFSIKVSIIILSPCRLWQPHAVADSDGQHEGGWPFDHHHQDPSQPRPSRGGERVSAGSPPSRSWHLHGPVVSGLRRDQNLQLRGVCQNRPKSRGQSHHTKTGHQAPVLIGPEVRL